MRAMSLVKLLDYQFQLVDYLNQFVIGQENAKKVLSVA